MIKKKAASRIRLQSRVVVKMIFLVWCRLFLSCRITVWRLAQWRILEHKTVNTPQKLMRGRMFN